MTDGAANKQPARLIIPFWGDVYANTVVSITLPAILAPDNLPALSASFDVELTIVTESRLFETVRASRSYLAACKVCKVRLVPLDDLITGRASDYGMMLTYALFRGFTDLGARMTETYLLFLNADFIPADGSLRHLAKVMGEGWRVVHSPSFRVTFEEIRPQLEARVDPETGTLRVPPREMARLALAHRHRTVRARTVNQRFYFQTYQDQFYWYVDEETLIGYQWPVALVAIKPERIVTEPVTFWDFGFIPEAAPAAQPCFIGDSDHFFMIELEARDSGRDMIRLGGASADAIAAVLSGYATKEHCESGQQLLTIHAGDLPDNLDAVVSDSRAYMAEIFRRLPAKPVSHLAHPRLGQWFDETKRHRRGPADADPQQRGHSATRNARRGLATSALFCLQSAYQKMFGSPPNVSPFHPLWADVAPIARKVATWQRSGSNKILWISSVDGGFGKLLGPRINPSAILVEGPAGSALEPGRYDACLCQLGLAELLHLDELYARIRPFVREGGEIVVNVTRSRDLLDSAATLLELAEYPRVDISEIHFHGSILIAFARKLYLAGMRPIPTRRLARGLIVSALIVFAPVVWLGNRLAARRSSTAFSPGWTSLSIEFAVQRAQRGQPGQERQPAMPDSGTATS